MSLSLHTPAHWRAEGVGGCIRPPVGFSKATFPACGGLSRHCVNVIYSLFILYINPSVQAHVKPGKRVMFSLLPQHSHPQIWLIRRVVGWKSQWADGNERHFITACQSPPPLRDSNARCKKLTHITDLPFFFSYRRISTRILAAPHINPPSRRTSVTAAFFSFATLPSRFCCGRSDFWECQLSFSPVSSLVLVMPREVPVRVNPGSTPEPSLATTEGVSQFSLR